MVRTLDNQPRLLPDSQSTIVLRQVPVEPKPTGCALCRRQRCHFDNRDWRDRCDNKLRNPHAAPHNKWLGAEIDQNDLHFAAVIRIDGSRRVQDSNTVLRARPERGRIWPS